MQFIINLISTNKCTRKVTCIKCSQIRVIHVTFLVHLLVNIRFLIEQREHWHSMMLIRYFSMNTAATTTAIQSHDHCLHYTTHSDIQLTVTLTWKYQVYWSLLDKTSEMFPDQNSGWVSKQAKRTTMPNPLCREKCWGSLVHLCWNELQPSHAWSTSFGECLVAHIPALMAVTAPNRPCRQVLASVQEVPRELLENHEHHHTRHWWKSLAGGLVRLLLAFFCLNVVVKAVHNTLLQKGHSSVYSTMLGNQGFSTQHWKNH
jgi:hypothetical protein